MRADRRCSRARSAGLIVLEEDIGRSIGCGSRGKPRSEVGTLGRRGLGLLDSDLELTNRIRGRAHNETTPVSGADELEQGPYIV